MAIRAPFNFVPVSDKVFFPEWADQINHDIPFSDGLSGTINLKITAESPIFVRNGHTEKDREEKNENYSSFSNVEGQYFIPGTSLKGAIRNVLEILSFGKMRINKDAKFAQREWDNKNNIYPLKDQQNNFHCGWLRRCGKNYKIIDCGKPYRIGQSRLDEWLGEDVFRNNFSKDKGIDLKKEVRVNNKMYDPKTAEYKYHLIGNKNLTGITFKLDDEFCNDFKENRVKVAPDGNLRGTIVLTGQPDKWMWPRPEKLTPGAGKFYEFVFEETEENIYDLSENEFNHFKFIYAESTEWNRIKHELESARGVPVFFRLEKNNIKDFGIAYLYKLPYANSAYDTLNSHHKENEKLDLAECIFGTENKQHALKGRVQFGNAICKFGIVDNELIFTMGSPKASFYPIYIKQKDTNKGKVGNYSTYNDSQIKGWKRYHIREQVFGNKTEYNESLDTKLIPLSKGSVFESKVSFHNLKPLELAALISSITFHKTEGCYHQIGHGKPFGLGKSNIQIEDLNIATDFNLNLWLAKFEEKLSDLIKCDWHAHDSIVQLFTIARIHVNQVENAAFEYMKMSVIRSENEFITAKQMNEYLQYYSELKKQKVFPASFLNKYKEQIQNEIESKEREKKLAEERANEERIHLVAQALEQARIDSNKIPLSEKIARADKFPTIFGNLKTWMKLNELQRLEKTDIDALTIKLIDVYSKMKPNAQKHWLDFKKWTELSKVVGEEVAKMIFNKVLQ